MLGDKQIKRCVTIHHARYVLDVDVEISKSLDESYHASLT